MAPEEQEKEGKRTKAETEAAEAETGIESGIESREAGPEDVERARTEAGETVSREAAREVEKIGERAAGNAELGGKEKAEALADGEVREVEALAARTAEALGEVGKEKLAAEEAIRKFKEKANLKAEHLLKSRAPLAKVAKLLGAEQFLTFVEQANGAVAARLDFKGFIDKQIADGAYLQLPTDYITTDEVLLPPDLLPMPKSGGETEWKEQGEIPRQTYAAEVLSAMEAPYSVVDGTVNPGTMRKLSYQLFIIPSLDKCVFVSNQPENATFVVHGVSGAPQEWQAMLREHKSEFKVKENVDVLRYTNNDPRAWKVELQQLLSSEGKKDALDISALESVASRPEGAKTPVEIAKELNIRLVTVMRMFAKRIKSEPAGFRRMANETTVYALADTMASMRAEVGQKRENPPEGSERLQKLYDRFGKTHVRKMLQRYQAEHPGSEPVAEHYSKRGKPGKYVLKEAIDLMEQEAPVAERAPEGHLTYLGAAKELGVSTRTVENWAEEYREEHPEWFHDYYMKSRDRVLEHLHPDLINTLRTRAKKR